MSPTVRILMCTHNGATYLPAQLQSFCDQQHGDWSLWVGDDNSTDTTLDILAEFAREEAQRDVRILPGPCAGSARNFLALLGHPELEDGYVAFSDQDDVWFPDKLTRALELLETGDPGRRRSMPAGPF